MTLLLLKIATPAAYPNLSPLENPTMVCFIYGFNRLLICGSALPWPVWLALYVSSSSDVTSQPPPRFHSA